MDICVPMRVKSIVRKCVFTRKEFTRYIFHAFEAFRTLIRKLQKKLDKKLVVIINDHGTKFENSNFVQYYESHGVDHNFSSPRTPQQNRVEKMKNRTLQEMDRTMMIASNITNQFWVQPMNDA